MSTNGDLSTLANGTAKESPPPPKYHTITVCMVPHPSDHDVWERVTKARTDLKDPGLFRWPPHVNLLYPFVSIKPPKSDVRHDSSETVDTEILKQLREATELCEPFRVSLDTLGTFGGNKRGVLWFYPKSSFGDDDDDDDDDSSNQEPLHKLQFLLEGKFPACSDQRKHGPFNPHMTISHFQSLTAALEGQKTIESWWPQDTSFMVHEIYLLQRKGDDGQFLRVGTLKLGEIHDHPGYEAHNPPLAFPAMPSEELDWVREERTKMKERRPWKGRRRGRSRQAPPGQPAGSSGKK